MTNEKKAENYTENDSIVQDYNSHINSIHSEKIFERIKNFDKNGSGYVSLDDYLKNRKIGNYEITETLGQGSFSVVKIGKDTTTGNEVALKIMSRYDKSEKNSEHYKKKEQRVYREALISLLVNHPHIIKLKDFYYNEFYFYMVFEKVKGTQLLDVISKRGPLDETATKKYFLQILSAVEYLHSNSIVHRDLKIENIMVDEEDNIQIIDFGLSNFYDNKNNLKTFCGSLYFAAPELLNGIEYGGPEIDIWSLGIILYVMACGKVPFDDPNIRKLHKKIKQANLTFHIDINEKLKTLLGNIIDSNPENRYSVKDILNDPWIAQNVHDIHYKSYAKKRESRFINYNDVNVKILGKILKPQFPNLLTEIKSFSKLCEDDTSNRERFFWDNLPSISLYFLIHQNFDTAKLKVFDIEMILSRDEGLHSLAKNLNSVRIEPDISTSIVYDNSSSETKIEDLSDESLNNDNTDCKNKDTCKHSKKSHKALRKWIKKYLATNNIDYTIKDKSYMCLCKRRQLKFRITLYCNAILRKHFLSLTRLQGEKNDFNRMVKNINNMLLVNSKIKKETKYRKNNNEQVY